MQYSISLKDVTENDQLVLRLIFSLSAKARGRTHSYYLSEKELTSNADICVQLVPAELPLAADTTHTVWLAPDTALVTTAEYIIRKPLIASRVLGILDRYVDEQLAVVEQKNGSEPGVNDSVSIDLAPAADAQSEMEFSISEEEASELAIVDDETLSNPANAITAQLSINEPTPQAAPIADKKNVTSLIVLHNNKEMAVSKHAMESRSLIEPQTTPRALVVDDSPSVRKQIQLELDLFNVDVDYAESVADAREHLQNNEYDIVFLDVVLPDGDGFGICRAIRAGASQPTVIMLTGKATPADKIKGTMAGCDAYLVKPVGRMTFQNTVCNYLQLREQLEVIHTSLSK